MASDILLLTCRRSFVPLTYLAVLKEAGHIEEPNRKELCRALESCTWGLEGQLLQAPG
jgi:hypothetical protein